MEKLFGTDGIRGIPGKYPLTQDLVRKAGFVAASLMVSRKKDVSPRRECRRFAVMGRDSRGSGVSIGRWLSEGMRMAGCGVADVGVMPTPAVSYLVPRLGALCGVVISASHNPPEFNGIKFFSSDGFKLEEELEREIESRIFSLNVDLSRVKAALPGENGLAPRNVDAGGNYSDFIKSTVPPDLDFSGLKIVLDCANGAASRVAPRILRGLGAEVRLIGCSPDGKNINLGCGALDTGAMTRETRRSGADCGISLDGDSDRAILADEKGVVLDGDHLMSMAASELLGQGRLRWNKIAVTVMSNYGFFKYLDSIGVATVQVPVGDRNVTGAIERERLSLGGESSGHIIFREFAPTGDGILTAVQALCIVRRSGRPLSFFRKRWARYPHVLEAVKVAGKVPLESIPGFKGAIVRLEKKLGGKGRIFVRYSGTEPVLRVLVEGPSRKLIAPMAREIVEYYKGHV